MSDIARTVWRPTTGVGEYGQGTVDNIVDPSGVDIVDPSDVQLVSPDGSFTDIPKTVWTSEDGS